MDCNWSARASYTRINNTDIDRSWRKVAIAGGQNPCTRGDMLRRNVVRNVESVSIRNNAQHDSFQHTDITITKTKIGHKRNNWAFGRSRLLHAFFLLVSVPLKRGRNPHGQPPLPLS